VVSSTVIFVVSYQVAIEWMLKQVLMNQVSEILVIAKVFAEIF